MQQSFSDIEFEGKKRKTRKELFLETMEQLIPWDKFMAIIKPHYHTIGEKGGRPPYPLCKILRMYLVQLWFNMSDETAEDSVYENQVIRRFVGINLSDETIPDATTLLRFRHLLEKHKLDEKIFDSVSELLKQNGYMMSKGSIVDASIITASSSTKNQSHSRDPEMAQTKKGSNYYFGMKAHTGVDFEDGFVHTVEYTAANEHDITKARVCVRDDDEFMHGDAGFVGVEKREEFKDMPDLSFQINQRRSNINKLPDCQDSDEIKYHEKEKSRIRAKVELPFHIVKNVFGYKKTRYKGLRKNASRLNMLFALANLYICRLKGITALPQTL